MNTLETLFVSLSDRVFVDISDFSLEKSSDYLKAEEFYDKHIENSSIKYSSIEASAEGVLMSKQKDSLFAISYSFAGLEINEIKFTDIVEEDREKAYIFLTGKIIPRIFVNLELVYEIPEEQQGIFWDALNKLMKFHFNSDGFENFKLLLDMEYNTTNIFIILKCFVREYSEKEIVQVFDTYIHASFLKCGIKFPDGARFFVEQVLEFKKI